MSSSALDHPFSVPRYPSGQPCPAAREHLLVSQDDGRQTHAALAAQLGQARLEHLALADFAGPAALQLALRARLQQAHAGLRLYLSGDEAFAWPLHALARSAGLEDDEILLDCPSDGTRRVFCVHCATCQDAASGEHHTCAKCGVALEVRRHFSQRLGAYLGVCADADQPYAQVRP